MVERSNIRIRHEAPRRRRLTVAARHQLTPGLLSIIFACDDWEGFVSASADDHIKLFIGGPVEASGKPPMRDYTPRAFDPGQGTFTIDFALHEDPGPATAWAMAAKPGDSIEIGGPRGSVVIDDSYDWYWLIGDETAIPSITRRLAEWPDAAVTSFIAVTGCDEELALPGAVHWAHRSAHEAASAAALIELMGKHGFPAGDGFIWIAAEASATKALREYILSRGHPQQQMKASGYWTAGMADTTAKFE